VDRTESTVESKGKANLTLWVNRTAVPSC